MRLLASILFCMAVSTNAYADAVAGRTHILLEGRQPFWVPSGGGPAIPLATSWGLPVSAAFDGENFLVIHGGDGPTVLGSFYAEAAREPFLTITLETQSGGHIPHVVWDGTRYIAIWSRPFEPARGAAITRQGAVTGTFHLPAEFRVATGLAANGTQVLVLTDTLLRAPERTLTITAALLDANLALQRTFVVDTIPAGPEFVHDQPFLSTIEAVPFGNGFYLAAARGDAKTTNQITGTFIAPDGSLLNRSVLEPVISRVFDADLVLSGERLIAVLKRVGLDIVTGTFIAPDGSTLGPQRLSPFIDLSFDAEATPSAVRLPTGELVLVSVGAAGMVTPLRDAPSPPRQRSVRH
jgi:hypothetical protein